MKKVWLTACVAALGFASPAYAVSFVVDDYTVNQFVESPGDLGLNITATDVMTDDYGFSLDFVGDWHETGLFRIGTTESAAAQSDDQVQKPISVDLLFSTPSFAGSEAGVTGGTYIVPGNLAATFGCILADGCGYVVWGAPTVLSFGTTGLLQIALSDALFGSPGTALVKAKFTLLQEDAAPVPEPGTLALFGTGLAAAGARLRRRRQKH
jgi:hypothetical protein